MGCSDQRGRVATVRPSLAAAGSPGYFEVDLGESLEAGNEDALRAFYLLFRRESFVPQDGAVATFLEMALAEGKRYEAQVAQDLSSVVFDAGLSEARGSSGGRKLRANLCLRCGRLR